MALIHGNYELACGVLSAFTLLVLGDLAAIWLTIRSARCSPWLRALAILSVVVGVGALILAFLDQSDGISRLAVPLVPLVLGVLLFWLNSRKAVQGQHG